MRIRYMGKFNGDYDTLPHREHMPGAVPFEEPKTAEELSKKILPLSIILQIPATIALVLIIKTNIVSVLGVVLALLMLIPHEFVHALCFKENTYIFTNLKQGMLFVVGTESMSKMRFILMSLMPNLVFGFLPVILFLINPNWTILGTLGLTSIPMGIGDYYNVYNAIKQMPKGARTYLYKFNSYWYMS